MILFCTLSRPVEPPICPEMIPAQLLPYAVQKIAVRDQPKIYEIYANITTLDQTNRFGIEEFADLGMMRQVAIVGRLL